MLLPARLWPTDDGRSAPHLGVHRPRDRQAGVHGAVKLTDALIAATAVVHGLSVVTQDEDFERIAAAHSSLRVLRV